MPVLLAKANKGEGIKTIVVSFGEDSLVVKYNRAKYTPKLERALNEKMRDGLPGAMISGFLTSLIIDWDLKDIHPEDKEKYEKAVEKKGDHLTMAELEASKIRFVDVPFSEEALDEHLATEFQSKIVEALAEDQRPNQKPSDFTSDI